ncbi:MinD/ParA family ATP-binding protein [Bounagaea algeriensis]
MTGRYEEPETRPDSGTRQEDVPASDAAESAEVSGGRDGYAEPATKPAHPAPSYVDPNVQRDPHAHGALHAHGNAAPYQESTPSGPQPGPQPANGASAGPASAPGSVPQPLQSPQSPQPGNGENSGGFQVGPAWYQQPQQPAPQQPAQPGQPAPQQPAAPGQQPPGQQPPGQQTPGQPAPGQPAPGQPVQPGPSGPVGQPGPPMPAGSYAPGQPQGPTGPAPQGQVGGAADPTQDLSSAQLLRQTKRPPRSGWRKAVYVASGKTLNLGESPADKQRRELVNRINQPLHGCYKIAMLSLKGGVGKTTSTASLGSTFASLRGDRVVAVDANPDRGTLSQKIPQETAATVRHLLRDSQRIRKYSDVRAYTSQGPSRLEVLASEQDPAVSEAFSEDDYRRTATVLEHFYNLVLTDCGTGLMHSAMKGVLDLADSLVIVSSSSIDGARSASATVDWLDAHGYGDLVSRSVAIINGVRPSSGKVDVSKLAQHFEARCRAVVKIPFDAHLEEGAEVDLDRIAAPTRLAMLQLAALVADDFPYALGRQTQG